MRIAGQELHSADELADWIALGQGEHPGDQGPADVLGRIWRDAGEPTRRLIADGALTALERGDATSRAHMMVFLRYKSHPSIDSGLAGLAGAAWLNDDNPLYPGEKLGRAWIWALTSGVAQDDEAARKLLDAQAPGFDAEDLVLSFYLALDAAGEGLQRLKSWTAAGRPLSPIKARTLALQFAELDRSKLLEAAACLASYPEGHRRGFLEEALDNTSEADLEADLESALGLD